MTNIIPPQDSAIARSHEHVYQVIARETIIVRFCSECGKTWTIIRYTATGQFTKTWEEVRETE